MHEDGQTTGGDRPAEDATNPAVAHGQPDHLALCSLILSAVDIPHWYDRRLNALRVAAGDLESARHHLDSYFEENRAWPQRPSPPPPPRLGGNQPTLLMMGSLAIFFLVTGPWQHQADWFIRGAIDSETMANRGEWWRLITALTLHADLVHLAGNCLIGGFLVHLLNRTLGYGIASLLLVACGALGNLLNIVARDQVHHSVGFSTAVFAAIGLFSGMQMLADSTFRARNILLSLGAGAGLLAMLGASGERTDLGAHLFGFLCGLAAGILCERLQVARLADRAGLQLLMALIAAVAVIASWSAAFAH